MQTAKKTGRNDPCSCGSGKKFKHCCQRRESARTVASPISNNPISINPLSINIGLAHHKAGRLGEAQAVYRQILQQTPEDPDALHLSGLIAYQTGNNEAAIKLIGKAIQVKPSAAMHYNLATALQKQGKFEVAIRHFEQALQLKPDYPEASNNLGTTLMTLGNLGQALKYYQQALASNPDFAEAHSNIAVVLQKQGKLDSALQSYRTAIQSVLNSPPAPAPGRKPMQLEPARVALLAVRERMMSANIPFFLCLGTLLGIVRDGDLLPFDKDMDLGLPWSVDRQQAIDALTKDGAFHCRIEQNRSAEDRQWYISFIHATTGILVDLFFFRPDGEHFLCGINHKPAPMLSRPRHFELDTLTWQGVEWMAPAPCDQYLADMYGPDWRTPDPNFDTVLSSYCMTPESRDARRCYGYLRLYRQLKTRSWRKAYGYCQQIVSLRKDSFLEVLALQIDQQQLSNPKKLPV